MQECAGWLVCVKEKRNEGPKSAVISQHVSECLLLGCSGRPRHYILCTLPRSYTVLVEPMPEHQPCSWSTSSVAYDPQAASKRIITRTPKRGPAAGAAGRRVLSRSGFSANIRGGHRTMGASRPGSWRPNHPLAWVSQ